ncbi:MULTISPECIES: hypothetical protein [unclassified Halomonas]|uniref:hypothetical protein n=1 Tax=unclassified Halomonas TaxID=2609666 RepID=UPI00207696BA|nr:MULTISPECIES: hypothetical protein [unclassified Halomonas]
MHPNQQHPFTGRSNGRYLTVVVAVKEEAADSEIRKAVAAFPLFESPANAPECEFVAISIGDALSELEKLEAPE